MSDWIDKGLERVARELAAKFHGDSVKQAEEEYSPIFREDAGIALAVLRRELRPLLEAGDRPVHYECEDGFYSCPKAENYFGPRREHCSCGKDDWDAAKKKLLEGKP